MRIARALLPAITLLGPACLGNHGADSSLVAAESCEGEATAAQIGTGTDEWEPLTEGQELSIIHGPQGGYHLVTAVLFDNMDSFVEIEVGGRWPAASEEVCVGHNRVAASCAEECRCQSLDLYCHLDVSDLASNPEQLTAPELLSGESLCLSIMVEDQSGRTASDEVCVVAG